MKAIFLIASLILIPSLALAGAGRSDYTDISDSRLQIISGSMSRLYVYDVTMKDSECGIKTVPTLFFDDDIAIAKEIYSMILMAKATGKEMEFIAGSCVSIGSDTYPSITSVYIK